jgi:hypothetical protein
MSTTFEEAKECPKCGKVGEDRRVTQKKDSRGRPVEIHLIYCVTELCTWFGTPWTVQVNEDGSIPEAYSGLGPKKYDRISQESASRIEDNVGRQLENETQPGGGEIRNPLSGR